MLHSDPLGENPIMYMTMAGPTIQILKEKIDRLLLLLFALIVIVTGLVFILPKKQVITNTKPKFLEQVVSDQNNTRNKSIPLNSNKKMIAQSKFKIFIDIMK